MDSDESKLRNFQGPFQDQFFSITRIFMANFTKHIYIYVMANILKCDLDGYGQSPHKTIGILTKVFFHFWFKFDDPRLNRSQVIVQTNLWLTYMKTNAGNNNRLADWIFIQLKSKDKWINPLVYTTGYTWSWVQKITTYGLNFNCPISMDTLF